jgi:NAD(P)-dependent dehydrogenase (short-subunit alcohol dehydrogenase family)
MRELHGRASVVTGAASGIGLCLAQQLAREGMDLVLADVDQDGLNAAIEGLRAEGRRVIGVRTDVASSHEVDALAAAAVEAYGPPYLVCANADAIRHDQPLVFTHPEFARRAIESHNAAINAVLDPV